MDNEIIKYIEILKWPVVALVVIWIFRKPIKELILNIADFSITKDGLSARIARPSAKISSNKLTEAINFNNSSESYVLKNKEGEVFLTTRTIMAFILLEKTIIDLIRNGQKRIKNIFIFITIHQQ